MCSPGTSQPSVSDAQNNRADSNTMFIYSLLKTDWPEVYIGDIILIITGVVWHRNRAEYILRIGHQCVIRGLTPRDQTKEHNKGASSMGLGFSIRKPHGWSVVGYCQKVQ